MGRERRGEQFAPGDSLAATHTRHDSSPLPQPNISTTKENVNPLWGERHVSLGVT